MSTRSGNAWLTRPDHLGGDPACACDILRELHASELAPGAVYPLQASFEYSDGDGGLIVSKIQAEPVAEGQPLRWIVRGKEIFNNKGRAVKKFEPYFSAPEVGHRFEEPHEEGVTAVIFYDAAGRIARLEKPDGTSRRVEFSAWHVTSYDENDTVRDAGNSWLARSTEPGAGVEQQRAATLTDDHANTPGTVVLDSLGRNAVGIGHNRFRDGGGVLQNQKTVVYSRFDAEGKLLWVRDTRGNLVQQFVTPLKPARAADEPDPLHPETLPADSVPGYDIAGNLLYQHGADNGDRWILNDASGAPLLAWDFNERRAEDGTAVTEQRQFLTVSDTLRRPVEQWLTINDVAHLVARFEYIDTDDGVPDAKARNLCGITHRKFDPSGLTQTERVEFKGGVGELQRRLAKDYKSAIVDWSESPEEKLEAETFVRITEYDALSRTRRLYNWHRGVGSRVAVYESRFTARGLLASQDLVLRANKTADGYTEGAGSRRTRVIRDVTYAANGHRQHVAFGNGTRVRYHYDPNTFRLVQLRATRENFDPAFPSAPGSLRDARVLQNLHYTYDAVGNVMSIRDDAFEPAFFANQQVDAHSRYTYDALYRLVAATGRENGAAGGVPEQVEGAPFDTDFPLAAADAVRNYTQEYSYDIAGNLLQMRHQAGPLGSWTRTHEYATDSNRLTGTDLATPARAVRHQFDTHGNMLNLANVTPEQFMRWDHRDLIHMYDRGGGGRVYYTYDSSFTRARKVNENAAGTRKEWERIYLGGFEILRRYSGGALVEEIESLHVNDGNRRLLMVEDVLQTDSASLTPGPSYRYQYCNDLGSAILELDDQARPLSYEEFHPYGTTAYRLKNRDIRVAAKRYRFMGKERDEESGLDYHGARYRAPWLTCWMSCDPAGIAAGLNVYQAFRGAPTNVTDSSGAWPEFLDKRAPQIGKVVDGALSSGKDHVVEVAKELPAVLPIVGGAITIHRIATAPDPVKTAYEAGKERVTSIVPPAAMGFALAEGKSFAEGADEVAKKVPFAQSAEDLDKTVRAAKRGDTAEAVHHGANGVRHFTKQAGGIILMFAGGARGSRGGGAPEPVTEPVAEAPKAVEAPPAPEPPPKAAPAAAESDPVLDSRPATAAETLEVRQGLEEYYTARAQAIKNDPNIVRPEQRSLTTVSVTPAIGPEGEAVDLVTSTVDLDPKLLKPNEVLVPADGHTEVNVMRWARDNGYTLQQIHPSNPFCANCGFHTRNAGLEPPGATVSRGRRGGGQPPIPLDQLSDGQLGDMAGKENPKYR